MQLRLSGPQPIPTAVSAWVRRVLLGEKLAQAMEREGVVSVHLRYPLGSVLAALPLAAGLTSPITMSYRSGRGSDRALPERPRVLYVSGSPRDQAPLDLLSDRDAYLDAWSKVECTFETLPGELTAGSLIEVLQGSWDVIHLTCHAAPGAIVVEDALGYSELLPAKKLVAALPEGLSLLTIAACAGSRSTTASIASRTRARLHDAMQVDPGPSDLAGLAALRSGATVIGTRQEIEDQAAQRHFAASVVQVVAGVTPAEAVTSIDASLRNAMNLICWGGTQSISTRLRAGKQSVTGANVRAKQRPDGREMRATLLHAAATPAEKLVAAEIATHILPASSVADWAADLIRDGRAVPLLETLRRHGHTWNAVAQLGPVPRAAADQLRDEVNELSAPLGETLDLVSSLDPEDRLDEVLEVAIAELGHDLAVLGELHRRGLVWPDDTRKRWVTTLPRLKAIPPDRWTAIHDKLSDYWSGVAETNPTDARAWLAAARHLEGAGHQPAAQRALINACLHRRNLDAGSLAAALASIPESPVSRLVAALVAIDQVPVSAVGQLGAVVPELAAAGAADLAEIAAAERVDAAFRIGSSSHAAAIDQYEAHQSAGPLSRLRLEFYRLRSEIRSGPDPTTAERVEQLASQTTCLNTETPTEALRVASLTEALWDLADDLARARGDWVAALELTDKIAKSREQRGAPPVEIADALLNQYGPLLVLEEVKAASLRLRMARRSFEAADDIGGITRVLAAQAQATHQRGDHHQAISLATEAVALAGDPIAAGAAHATIARWSTADPRSPTAAAQHHMLFAAIVLSTVGAPQTAAALNDLAKLGLPEASTTAELVAALPLTVSDGANRLCAQLGIDRLDAALGQIRETFQAATGDGPDVGPLVHALAGAQTDPLLAALVTNYITTNRSPYLTDELLADLADESSEIVTNSAAIDQFVADLVPVSLMRVVGVLSEQAVVGLDDSDVRASLDIAAQGGHRSVLARSLLAVLNGERDPSLLLGGLQTPHAAAVVCAVRVLDRITPIETVAPTDAQLVAMADQARVQAAVAVHAARTGPTEALEAENLLARLAADPGTAPLAATLASFLDDQPGVARDGA